MKIIRSISEMQLYVEQAKKNNKTIGFVPTMGFLHEGHRTLMQIARPKNDILVVSIFVNPLQFGPNEDFERYPRDEAHDKAVAEEEQVDVLFMPEVDDMYPQTSTIQLTVLRRVNVLCGKSREGHFDGVATVLVKLFNIVQPNDVYFGLKDAQQVAVVDALITDFNFPITINPVSTVRESDGLAKSSRNVYLSDEERQEAKYLNQALQHGRKLVQNGEKNRKKIIEEVSQFINHYTHGKIDYVDLLSYPQLEKLEMVDQQVILATAVQFSRARLIDNVIFNPEGIITEELK